MERAIECFSSPNDSKESVLNPRSVSFPSQELNYSPIAHVMHNSADMTGENILIGLNNFPQNIQAVDDDLNGDMRHPLDTISPEIDNGIIPDSKDVPPRAAASNFLKDETNYQMDLAHNNKINPSNSPKNPNESTKDNGNGLIKNDNACSLPPDLCQGKPLLNLELTYYAEDDRVQPLINQAEKRDQEVQHMTIRNKYRLLKLLLIPVLVFIIGEISNRGSIIQYEELSENLRSEILSMPDCAERILLNLVYNTIECFNMSDLDSSLIIEKHNQIELELELLSQALKRENLESSKTKEILFEIKSKVRGKNWQGTSKDLENLLKEIRPLDIKEMCWSACRSNETECLRREVPKEKEMVLKDQIKRHQRAIMSSVNRFDYTLAEYKLGELKLVYETFEYEYANTVYDQCISDVRKLMNEGFQAGITALNQCLKNENTLNNKDVKSYKAHIEHTRNAQNLIDTHLGSGTIQTSVLLQNLENQAKKMLIDLANREINESLVNIIMGKLKLLATSFRDMSHYYDDARKIMTRKLDDTVSSYQSFVLSDSFDKSTEKITLISESRSILENHIDQGILEEIYQEVKAFFINYLNNCVEGTDSPFTREIFQNREIDILKKCIARIELANNTISLRPHIPTADINEAYDLLFDKIMQHCEDIFRRISRHCEEEEENYLERIRKPMEEMSLILAIPSMDSRISQEYSSRLSTSEDCVNKQKRQADSILLSISDIKEGLSQET